MTISFLMELSAAGLVILLYLLYRFIKLFEELVELLREEWKDIKDE